LDASKKTKTPSMTIYFDPPLSYAELEMKDDKDKVKYIEAKNDDSKHEKSKFDDMTNALLFLMQ
jgi:hypothetical protein